MNWFTLTIDNKGSLRDCNGQIVTLRGINVDSMAKMPSDPERTTYDDQDELFWDGDNASFVGRPFHINEARTHFERLKSWGYNVIRYIFTWEALEHKGPGIYDESFIAHTIQTLQIIKELQFYVILDPHQDMWSRYSGGCGAPMWTLYAAGLNPRNFETTLAAVVFNTYSKTPEKYPPMTWVSNSVRYACQLMLTMFFAGRVFTPKAIVNGQNIQDFLQSKLNMCLEHFYNQIASSTDLFETCILGIETLNEPGLGLLGISHLNSLSRLKTLTMGPTPTPYQAILLASGIPVEVDFYEFGPLGPYKAGTQFVQPDGKTAWLNVAERAHFDTRYGFTRGKEWHNSNECIWAMHGVWNTKTHELLLPEYFRYWSSESKADQKELTQGIFVNEIFTKYYADYRRMIRSLPNKNIFILCQPPAFSVPPLIRATDLVDNHTMYAPHFYDGLAQMRKHWNTLWSADCLGVLRGNYSSLIFAMRFGESAIRRNLRNQIAEMRDEGLKNIGPVPLFLSETGMPFDLDKKFAYSHNGNYKAQIQALDALHAAVESLGIHCTFWCYNARNTHACGDYWNCEDFSFVSTDPRADSTDRAIADNSNGIARIYTRAEDAFIRPFVTHASGFACTQSFDISKKLYILKLATSDCDGRETQPTKIFIPKHHFPNDKIFVKVSSGSHTYDSTAHLLCWAPDKDDTELCLKASSIEHNLPDTTHCTLA